MTHLIIRIKFNPPNVSRIHKLRKIILILHKLYMEPLGHEFLRNSTIGKDFSPPIGNHARLLYKADKVFLQD